jgi:hypothetical protein
MVQVLSRRMRDLDRQVRRSLALIGTLDNKSELATESLHESLKRLQELHGGTTKNRRDLALQISKLAHDAGFYRRNSLSEAIYVNESVDELYNEVASEILRLGGEFSSDELLLRPELQGTSENNPQNNVNEPTRVLGASSSNRSNLIGRKSSERNNSMGRKSDRNSLGSNSIRSNSIRRASDRITSVGSMKKFQRKEIKSQHNSEIQKKSEIQKSEFQKKTTGRPRKRKRGPRRYCICNKTAHGQMIACDNPSCPIEWYHLSCLRIKRVPQGSWYCIKCRK